MTAAPKNILITGLPGVGKTTLIKKLSRELTRFHPAGFYTEEIREGGIRKGFRIASIPEGTTAVLAHVGMKSPSKVGKYSVDVPSFEQYLDQLNLAHADTRLAIIDEIGKMECLSAVFRELIGSLLGSSTPVVATVALKGTGFIEGLKRREDVMLVEISEANRDSVVQDILRSVLPILS